MRSFSNYINGKLTPAGSGKTFAVRNPANHEETVATCADSDATDVKQAIDAASAAFEAWSRLPAPKRGAFLSKAAAILARRRDEAAELLTREEGKILAESRGEVDRAVGLLEYYGAQHALLGGEVIPSSIDNRMLYTLRVPLGVVALISPWNFPCAIPVWKAAPALLCGNTVVLKPAQQAPASACLFAEVLLEAGLPAGVFNLVTGSGRNVGEPLTSDPRIRAISFTGSLEVGRGIAKKCAERLIRVGLEMGGKNPHIVLEDADLDRAVNDIAVGAFWGAGHKCTACSRALVVDKVYDQFVEKMTAKASGLKVGPGLDASTQVPPVIDEKQLRGILDYVEIGRAEGARLAAGGTRVTGAACDKGWFIAPTVFVDVRPEMRIAQEEIFGPVLAVIRVKDFDEALRVANQIDFGLSAGISTRSLGSSMEFARRSEAGVLHVNNPTAGLELQAPFGGFKCSSSGYREMGRSAIDFYSSVKTVYVDM